MPLAPVIMVAVRVPDFARDNIAAHACSSVNWCRSNTMCRGVGRGCAGMRVDRCKCLWTVVRTDEVSGTNSDEIISVISVSFSCFIGVPW